MTGPNSYRTPVAGFASYPRNPTCMDSVVTQWPCECHPRVTIVPRPCGRPVGMITCGEWFEWRGERARATCDDCGGLGDLLESAALTAVTDDRDEGGPWSPLCARLAWNLTMAALLGAAASGARL